MEQKIVVSAESYVERWAREQAEKVVKPDDGQTDRSEGQEAQKGKRGRKQASMVEESDHS